MRVHDRSLVFETVRPWLDADGYTAERIAKLDRAIDTMLGLAEPPHPHTTLTARVAMELIAHEAIVQEAYRDTVGVWTWGVGVTSRSGHLVERYKDNPQPIRRCLEIYVWLLRERYIPPVLAAFDGKPLNEAQFAAALSFHYNTGAIGKTGWVTHWLQGRADEARDFLETHYLNDGTLKERRMKEAALFFDGAWSSDGKATVFSVRKPSYRPDFRKGRRVDVSSDLKELLA